MDLLIMMTKLRALAIHPIQMSGTTLRLGPEMGES